MNSHICVPDSSYVYTCSGAPAIQLRPMYSTEQCHLEPLPLHFAPRRRDRMLFRRPPTEPIWKAAVSRLQSRRETDPCRIPLDFDRCRMIGGHVSRVRNEPYPFSSHRLCPLICVPGMYDLCERIQITAQAESWQSCAAKRTLVPILIETG